jgi:hypothetical protein
LGPLKRTLESTNPCESMIECIRRSSRNVKHWQNGDMALRWTAAGMLEAERQFRRVIGHADLAKLANAMERDRAQARTANTAHTPSSMSTEETARGDARAKIASSTGRSLNRGRADVPVAIGMRR